MNTELKSLTNNFSESLETPLLKQKEVLVEKFAELSFIEDFQKKEKWQEYMGCAYELLTSCVLDKFVNNTNELVITYCDDIKFQLPKNNSLRVVNNSGPVTSFSSWLMTPPALDSSDFDRLNRRYLSRKTKITNCLEYALRQDFSKTRFLEEMVASGGVSGLSKLCVELRKQEKAAHSPAHPLQSKKRPIAIATLPSAHRTQRNRKVYAVCEELANGKLHIHELNEFFEQSNP